MGVRRIGFKYCRVLEWLHYTVAHFNCWNHKVELYLRQVIFSQIKKLQLVQTISILVPVMCTGRKSYQHNHRNWRAEYKIASNSVNKASLGNGGWGCWENIFLISCSHQEDHIKVWEVNSLLTWRFNFWMIHQIQTFAVFFRCQNASENTGGCILLLRANDALFLFIYFFHFQTNLDLNWKHHEVKQEGICKELGTDISVRKGSNGAASLISRYL